MEKLWELTQCGWAVSVRMREVVVESLVENLSTGAIERCVYTYDGSMYDLAHAISLAYRAHRARRGDQADA